MEPVSQKKNALLDVREIRLRFGGVSALEDVSLRVRSGEILSIIGPNGAGKTSLVNCITGYYKPGRGRALFGGRNLIGMPPHRIAGLGIGRTFQNPTTYPNMTALDILMAARYGRSRTILPEAMIHFGRSRREELENLEAVEELIRFTQIEELRKRTISSMPYGQRKQVEIARALAMEPRLLILDEPMSGLDEVMKEVVNDLIVAVHRRGLTIVLIEHDFQAVTDLSDTVIVLSGGRRIAAGTPEEIVVDPQVIDAYLGGAAAAPTAEVPK